ncbi:unnamed protein product [Cochlearia groenlandica]
MENAASLAAGPDGRKRRVSYIFQSEIGQPKIPYPSGLTHELIKETGLYRHMEIINRPIIAGVSDLIRFHTEEYIHFLGSVTPLTISDPSVAINYNRFFSRDVNLNRAGPLFHGLLDYCRGYVGSSLNAAVKLNLRESDIAINWTGGMHRARSSLATGFCFVNDVVLAIIELLKSFQRVLYIDIGFLHGDAVEEAFYNTNRVMTLSFYNVAAHLWEEHVYQTMSEDIRRESYAVRAPLKDGLSDASLGKLFGPVVNKAMEVYQPQVVVLQCGADSLADEGYGSSSFNLKVKGHGGCLQFVRSFNVPLLVLGGGGLNPMDVPRCWLYETAITVGVEKEFEGRLNVNQFFMRPNFMPDLNTPGDIGTLRNKLLRQISQLTHVPSVQFQETPPISQAIEPAEVDMDKRQKIGNLRSKL